MYLLKVIRNVQTKSLLNSVVFRECQTRAESNLTYSKTLSFINEKYSQVIPTYRVLSNTNEEVSPNIEQLKIDKDMLIKMYTTMISINVMDTILYESQRQGRISFYMTNFGEEAVQIGSAAALNADDLIYAQYRESGILLWRGYEFVDYLNQCYGNDMDSNKGRQMPVHYGSKKHNFVTLSSPLATQLPQAVGAAYGLKYLQKKLCTVCYFGEGAASEGDTHAAFNFAATLKCPILLVCRNNGYAISTPSHQQYNGDGIAAKGPAYGIQTMRVDGNDIVAMYHATKFARDYAVENEVPVLLEAMTYRIGHHSTSDDSTAYRSVQEINKQLDVTPIRRLKKYLEHFNLWSQEQEDLLIKSTKKSVLSAIDTAEKHKKPDWKNLFSDVYYNPPKHIKKQLGIMENCMTKYKDMYP